jgi:hypothetical protein
MLLSIARAWTQHGVGRGFRRPRSPLRRFVVCILIVTFALYAREPVMPSLLLFAPITIDERGRCEHTRGDAGPCR